jgi:hypothetical protein
MLISISALTLLHDFSDSRLLVRWDGSLYWGVMIFGKGSGTHCFSNDVNGRPLNKRRPVSTATALSALARLRPYEPALTHANESTLLLMNCSSNFVY